MSIAALSDLAFSVLRQRQVSTTRANLEKAGKELSTGQAADIRTATNGDLGKLFAIDRSLAKLSQRQNSLVLADGRASVVQSKLKILQDMSDQTGTRMLSAISLGELNSARTYAADAKQKLYQVVSSLNATYQGRSLFSGAAENKAALSGADKIIGDVGALVDASANANDAIAAIDNYFFATGGGFETDIYIGATEDAPTVKTADDNSVGIGVRGDDPSIRSVIRALAIAAAVSEGAFSTNVDEQTQLLTEAGNSMINAKENMILTAAELGRAQNQISQAQSTVADDVFSLEVARNEIAGVDPYEAASRFSDLEGQLQSMYTITARLSSLRLTNFLR